MLLLLLGVVMLACYPFSTHLFSSPLHFNPLFMLAHESVTHLAINLLSLLLVWLISRRTGTRQGRLLLAFFTASLASLTMAFMFNLPIIGSSVGIYAMIGYLLPEMVSLAPLSLSYPAMSLLLFFESGITSKAWEKLFHWFGLTAGTVMHYMVDSRRLKLIKQMTNMGLGFDMYAVLGAAYPERTKLVYRLK